MPYRSGAGCHRFRMSNDDTVAGLRDAIRKSLELKDEVELQAIFFMKVDI